MPEDQPTEKLARSPSTGSLIVAVVVSSAISGTSLWLLHAFPYEPNLTRALVASATLAVVWIALLVYAFVKFGKRALRLLVAAPPTLRVIVWMLAIPIGCGLGYGCL